LIAGINKQLKECKETEKEYKVLIYKVEEARLDCMKELPIELDKCQSLEENRVQFTKKIFINILNKDQQLNTERAHNFTENVGEVDKIAEDQEILSIIKQLAPKANAIEEIKYVKMKCKSEEILQKFDEYYTGGGVYTNFDIERAKQSIVLGIEQGTDETTQKLKTIIQNAITKSWNATSLTTLEQEQFNKALNNKVGRQIFCQCLNEYRRKGATAMTQKAYSSISQLVYIFMNYIEMFSDIDNGLLIIVLLETLYTEGKNEKGTMMKIYLQQAVAGHKYFSNPSFWEKALSHPLNEHNIQIPAENESKEEKKDREINEVCSRLRTHACNMALFNMDKNTIQKIVLKFARENKLPTQYIEVINVCY